MRKNLGTIILLGILLPVLCACSSSFHSGTKLSGDITGTDSDTLFAYGMDALYQGMDTFILDNGHLKATFDTDTLALVYLQMPSGYRHPIFIDKETSLKISGQDGHPGRFQVSGSTPNEDLSAFLLEHESALGDMDSMQIYTESYVREHPSDVVDVYLVDRYFLQSPVSDPERIVSLIKKMDLDLQDWSVINDYVEYYNIDKTVTVGSKSPYFRLKGINGTYISRNITYRDDNLIIYFWASWDKESRELHKMYRKLLKDEKKKDDISVLGICLDTELKDCNKAIEEDSIDWNHICDLKGWNNELVSKFAIRSLPREFLVNKDGDILGIDLMNQEEIVQKVQVERDKAEKLKAERQKRRS